jgi:hypothetical protein
MANRSNENDNEEQALLVAMIVLLFWRLVDGNIFCTTESLAARIPSTFSSVNPGVVVRVWWFYNAGTKPILLRLLLLVLLLLPLLRISHFGIAV